MRLFAAALFSVTLAACGGGGSSPNTPAPPPTPTVEYLTLSGTAATGKAIAGAVISVKCLAGTGTTASTADGTFSLIIAGGNLPCILQLANPADSSKLHTLAVGTGSSAIANITPLTEMVTARVFGNEPAIFFATFYATAAASAITTAILNVAQADVAAVLNGTLDTSTLANFISTPLRAATPGNPAGGDTQDKILDALGVKMTGIQLTQVVTALAHTNSTTAIRQVIANMMAVPPIANAGADQSVITGTLVKLNGSASSADLGRSLSYAWTLTSKPAGSVAVLTSPTSASPSFTPDVAGNYVASLIVNDGSISSSADAVGITATVANAAPVSNPGAAQSVTTGTLVNLNGSASSDANGDALTYAWALTAKPTGSVASLTGASSAVSLFTADLAGTYVASLMVSDGKVNSTPKTITVTAVAPITTPVNTAPVANPGAAQSVTTGALVTLNGTASSDAEGDKLTYAWTLTAKPVGSTVALAGATSAVPIFAADLAGTYIFSLTVNDGKASSAAKTVTVTASAAGTGPVNTAPVANVGSRQVIQVVAGKTFNLDGTVVPSVVTYTTVNGQLVPEVRTYVHLSGSASSDADGDPMTYSWSVSASHFPSSLASFSSTTTAQTILTIGGLDSYEVSLVVNDGKVNSTAATLVVAEMF